MRARAHKALFRAPTLALALLLIVGLTACGESAEKVEIQRSEVEEDLAEFLPLLAESYEDGNVERLRGYTTEKELARITRRVQEYADQGKILAPEFHSVAVEKVSAWSATQAFVNTVEVWDLRLYSIGSERRLIYEGSQESTRVTYQVRHDGERWVVFARQLPES